MNMRTFIRSLFAVLLIFLISCADNKESYEESESMAEVDMTAQGEYLVKAMGCVHCHTPKKMSDQGPVPDMDRYMMGHPANSNLAPMDSTMVGPWVLFHPDLTAAVGPWGTSFSGNLTPDDTGIGNWTLEQFKKAMTEGKFKGMDTGRPMMPPMPVFTDLKDDDVEAIFTYLKSIAPVENTPPSYRPPTAAN